MRKQKKIAYKTFCKSDLKLAPIPSVLLHLYKRNIITLEMNWIVGPLFFPSFSSAYSEQIRDGVFNVNNKQSINILHAITG